LIFWGFYHVVRYEKQYEFKTIYLNLNDFIILWMSEDICRQYACETPLKGVLARGFVCLSRFAANLE